MDRERARRTDKIAHSASSASATPSRAQGYLAQHWLGITLAIMGLHLILALLLFDPKVSIGGDDSWYVLAAKDFWDGLAYPSWHGALYPIVLSPLVAIFGMAIPLFKVISICFVLGSIFLLSKAFRGKIHPLAWLGGLLIYAVSTPVVVLSGTTYSEPLFLLLQAWVFYALFKVEEGERRLAPCATATADTPQVLTGNAAAEYPSTKVWGREWWLRILWLGLSIFLLSMVRNVGYGALIAVVVYLLVFGRRWRTALATLGVFAVLQVLLSLYKRLVWGSTGVSFAGQWEHMMQIDFYNASAGQEDLKGLLIRFVENCHQYLSYHLMQLLGLPINQNSWAIMVVVVALLLIVLFRKPRLSRTLWFTAFYLASMLGITFITQQVAWNQIRLVLVFLPLLLFYLYDALLGVKSQAMQTVLRYAIIAFTGIAAIGNLAGDLKQVRPAVLHANLSGDRYRGLTPDWDSYLRTCAWVGEHIPDSVVVACRKPNNARIYGDRPFFGIFKVPSYNADTVRMFLDSNRIDYVVVGHLRKYTEQRTSEYINTMHITLAVVLRYKPDLLELVHAEGRDEPTYLFRLHREPPDPSSPAYRARLEAGLMVDPENAEALHKLGMFSIDEGDPNAAYTYAERAIRLYQREKVEPPYPLMELLGIALYGKGDVKSAVNVFRKVAEEHPEQPNAWRNLGLAYQKLGLPQGKEYLAKAERMRQERERP